MAGKSPLDGLKKRDHLNTQYCIGKIYLFLSSTHKACYNNIDGVIQGARVMVQQDTNTSHLSLVPRDISCCYGNR